MMVSHEAVESVPDQKVEEAQGNDPECSFQST